MVYTSYACHIHVIFGVQSEIMPSLTSFALTLIVTMVVLPTVGFAQAERPVSSTGVTAHRGDSGNYVENTLPAFRSALRQDVDWLECDIFLTFDGQIVVTHDANTLELTGVDRQIVELTYSQIRALDTAVDFRRRNHLSLAALPPQRMPLLQEVLELVMTQSRVRLSIQPKDDSVAAAIALITEMGAAAWVGFNDSNLAKMVEVKQLAADVPVFWDRLDDADIAGDIATARRYKFESLVYNQNYVSAEAIRTVQTAGLEYGVWTVNDPQLMQRFIELGVDRLYTDHPAIALELLSAAHSN